MCGCVGSCCGTAAGNCCAAQCSTKNKLTRGPYVILMFLGVALAAILRFYGKPLLIHVYHFQFHLCKTEKCLGFGAVYRISFGLFLFFTVHALSQMGSALSKLHTSYWCGKVTMLIGTIIISLFIPNDFFDVYATIARFVSAAFLILQIVILIDFAYSWNESWTSEEKDWKWGVLAASLLMLVGSLVLLIFCFKWFADGHCPLEKFFLAFTIILTVVFLGISVSEWCEHGALLPSAVMTLYCWWLAYSALSSDPNSCNSLKSNENTSSILIGVVLAGAAVSYAGYSAGSSGDLFASEDQQAAMLDDKVEKSEAPQSADAAEAADAASVASEPPSDEINQRNQKFHWMMAAAAMYISMLLTNWGHVHDSSHVSYDLGSTTMWIKIVTQWVAILLYIWTLVAPKLLTDRDFS